MKKNLDNIIKPLDHRLELYFNSHLYGMLMENGLATGYNIRKYYYDGEINLSEDVNLGKLANKIRFAIRGVIEPELSLINGFIPIRIKQGYGDFTIEQPF